MAAGAAQMRALARDLKGAPKVLRSALRRDLVAAAKPIVTTAKSNAVAIPVRGSKSTGLRAALAAATKLSTRINTGATTGVSIRVTHPLAAYMEGSDGARSVRWRHPVYGNPPWVSQASHPFVAPAVKSHLAGVQAGVVRAVDETAARLAR